MASRRIVFFSSLFHDIKLTKLQQHVRVTVHFHEAGKSNRQPREYSAAQTTMAHALPYLQCGRHGTCNTTSNSRHAPLALPDQEVPANPLRIPQDANHEFAGHHHPTAKIASKDAAAPGLIDLGAISKSHRIHWPYTEQSNTETSQYGVNITSIPY